MANVFAFAVKGDIAETRVPLAAPTLNTVTATTQTSIDLAWTDNAVVGIVSIQRSLDPTENFVEIDIVLVGVGSYTDSPVVADTVYYYRVAAFNTELGYSYSNIISADTSPEQSYTITFAAAAATGNNDWFSFNGLLVEGLVPYLQVDGGAAPSFGALYSAQASLPSFSGATATTNVTTGQTAAQVATAFLGITVTGGSYEGSTINDIMATFYTVTNNGDGTVDLVSLTAGTKPDPVTSNEAETTAGSITVVVN